ncbi:MAG: hypothetical protein ACFNYZ_06700, partial [Pauljensenia sp.]
MSFDLGVDTDLIRSHASDVSSCADMLNQNVSTAAATQGQVSGNAFGIICSFFVPPVSSQIKNLQKMIEDCAGAESRLVNCLYQWAQEMDDLETKIEDKFKKEKKESGDNPPGGSTSSGDGSGTGSSSGSGVGTGSGGGGG